MGITMLGQVKCSQYIFLALSKTLASKNHRYFTGMVLQYVFMENHMYRSARHVNVGNQFGIGSLSESD